jgi:hypothetical protein
MDAVLEDLVVLSYSGIEDLGFWRALVETNIEGG